MSKNVSVFNNEPWAMTDEGKQFQSLMAQVLHYAVWARNRSGILAASVSAGPTLDNLTTDLKGHPTLKRNLEKWGEGRLRSWISTYVKMGCLRGFVMTNKGVMHAKHAGIHWQLPTFRKPSEKELAQLRNQSRDAEQSVEKLMNVA